MRMLWDQHPLGPKGCRNHRGRAWIPRALGISKAVVEGEKVRTCRLCSASDKHGVLQDVVYDML